MAQSFKVLFMVSGPKTQKRKESLKDGQRDFKGKLALLLKFPLTGPGLLMVRTHYLEGR